MTLVVVGEWLLGSWRFVVVRCRGGRQGVGAGVCGFGFDSGLWRSHDGERAGRPEPGGRAECHGARKPSAGLRPTLLALEDADDTDEKGSPPRKSEPDWP